MTSTPFSLDERAVNVSDVNLKMTSRVLQEANERGQTVLTIMYLCVLTSCFLVPLCMYCRMHVDDRRERRIRETEIASITLALTESQNINRDVSRAARRKFREERRARIVQLFIPVRMILKEGNFDNSKIAAETNSIPVEISTSVDKEHEYENDVSNADVEAQHAPLSNEARIEYEEEEKSEKDLHVWIPEPGLPNGAVLDLITSNALENNNSSNQSKQKVSKLRKVPIDCSICLCEYTVGSDVVWSSNPLCDHVFHASCIEMWLMKQREGPLCPCCRRDFVIDPFDDMAAVLDAIPDGPDYVEDLSEARVEATTGSSDVLSGPAESTHIDVINSNQS